MKIADLLENFRAAPLRKDLIATMPPTVVIPELQNNDSYAQYRYLLALASVEAIKRGEVEMSQQSAWNENTSVVCYSPEEFEIVNMANKLMGVTGKKISTSPSQEPKHVNTASPVRPFVDVGRD
jgi:hypothetical protein